MRAAWTQVVVKSAAGKTVDGTVGADGVWRSKTTTLPYNTTFTLTAKGVDSAGLGREVHSKFTTINPSTGSSRASRR